MDQISGSPYAWLTFNKDGALTDSTQLDAVRAIVARQGVSDVVVISHGWQNDKRDARKLYETLWGNVVPGLQGLSAANIAVCGIQWPAKAFETDFDSRALRMQAEGGALSAVPRRTLPGGI